jgi:hypothetical protein
MLYPKRFLQIAPFLLLLGSWLPAAPASAADTAQTEYSAVTDINGTSDKTLLSQPIRKDHSILWLMVPVAVIAGLAARRAHPSRKSGPSHA